MGDVTLDCFSKRWDPMFSTDRGFKEDWSRSWVDIKRDYQANFCDGLELFLQDDDACNPDCRIEELLKFAASFSLEELKGGFGSAGQRRGGWLDERSSPDCNNSRTREHKNPLTATRLYELLKTPRIGNKDAPDANRRLVYIENLDPQYMLALAETARFHEVPILRDAFWNHRAGQTSLQVKISRKNYPIFRLQFHLQHFVYKPLPSTSETQTPKDQWTDLSFLEIPMSKRPEGRECGMFESRFSTVIYGSSEKQWAVYAFDDTESDEEDLYEKMIGTFQPFHADPIVSCLRGDDVDADLPIWNLRRYFLLAVANRMTRAVADWENLMRTVEQSIREYTKRNPSTLSQPGGSTKGRGDSAKKAFDWSYLTKELLSRLRDALSRTIKCWEQFKPKDGGDIGFFLDVECPDDKRQINFLLGEIKEQFEKLGVVSGTLETLMETCKDYANHLQLRLSLESNETTKLNGAAQDFTIFVLGPPALAAACLQLSPAMVPLPPTRESFIILTVIFFVAMKILYLIRGALPEVSWWWSIVKAPVKNVNMGDLGNPLSVCCNLGRHVRKQRNNIDDSKTQDV